MTNAEWHVVDTPVMPVETAGERRSGRRRRVLRDTIIRLAVAVLVLDWMFVRWTTFLWLDIAALAATAAAMKIDVARTGRTRRQLAIRH